MRGVLWLLALFVVAVVSALFAGNNHNTLTIFWSPHRIDVSFNLAAAVLIGLFVLLHLALNGVAVFLRIPQQARQWRLSHRERSIHVALLEAMALLVAGRFVRARRVAERALEMQDAVAHSGEKLPHAAGLRAMTHLLAAESAHAVLDRAGRDAHHGQTLTHSQGRDAQDIFDGARLRAARWALDDRDPARALHWLNQLAPGTARRTLALRLRFKSARLGSDARIALDTARQLTKHRAFSELAGASIARGLAIELLQSAHDSAQIQRAWSSLDVRERHIPEVALYAAQRLRTHGGDVQTVLGWIDPVWKAACASTTGVTDAQRVQLVKVLEASFDIFPEEVAAQWLARLEQVQQSQPRVVAWQYAGGVACMHMRLWGKAQQLLTQAVAGLTDAELRRRAWALLGAMAEQRQDSAAALRAYREASTL